MKTRRVATLIALSAAFVGFGAAPASAHGYGGRADLPVPVSYFIVGAGIALVISFLALAVLWPEPRLQERKAERPITARWLRPLVAVLRTVGLAGLLLVVVTGVANRNDGRTISPVLVWVYFWLVIPFISAGIGNWWRALSPWRSIAAWVNPGSPERPDRTASLGIWPAVIAFVAFTWLELVADSSGEARTLALAAVVYSIYLLVATRYAGVESGLRAAGAFENYNEVLGSISPVRWGRATDDAGAAAGISLSYRGWLRGLPSLPDTPGFTALVIAMIGTVTYDGISGAAWWGDAFGTTRGEAWFGTVALLGTVGVIAGAYWLASALAARIAAEPGGALRVARSFAHTLVPIALAYAFAHYFTLVLVEGQTLLHAASDPFGLGWNLFGTAEWRISWVPAPEWVWYIQVASIVAGHVAGVALAHDRALHEFGGRVAVRTQYAMLVLMVALTTLGLLILSG
jgi:hypothetical protein